MQRMPMIERENISGDLEVFYDSVTALLGRVPRFYRTIASAPWLAMCFLPINATAQRQWPGTRISGRVKELVVIKTSHVNGCDYCYAHNTALGAAAGITHDEVIEMSSDDYLDSKTLSDAEKAAIRWAEAMTRNTAGRDDALFAELKEHFSDGEIIEISMVCAMFNMINRLTDSLGVPIEEQAEIDLIKPSLHLDPAKIKDYVTWMAGFWPDADFESLNRQAAEAAARPAEAAE
ncbi:carboxymuconolactone decarboxylase family protein [Nitratireductor sp. XY-223]|uniref:carboxymuconolactone decarboxylase family protein n=1 Tax=Nitratireductor sp. XY-223 TaxID=2561926 RepID=UPI0010AA337F|nr:carboxymuconolactone decarboxylase family protein [Nitratireductor sp. XY-223]